MKIPDEIIIDLLSYVSDTFSEWNNIIRICKQFYSFRKEPIMNKYLNGICPKNIKNEDIYSLSKLVYLQSLDLSKCYKITDNGFFYIQYLTNLTKLNLEYTNITDNCLNVLSTLSNLHTIKIGGNIINQDIYYLSNLTSLQNISFTDFNKVKYDNPLHNGLKSLSNLSCLNTLSFRKSYLINNEIEYISKLPGITSLHFEECPWIRYESMLYFKNLTNIQSLKLDGCIRITDDCVRLISTIINLVSLNLKCCWFITYESISYIIQLTSLKLLNVEGCSLLTDNSFRLLSNLKNLVSLNAKYCPITYECVLYLKTELPIDIIH